MKEFDFSEVNEGKIYDFLKPLEYTIRGIVCKVKYIGQENIPKTGGFILAGNHVNTYDPLVVGLGIKKRQVHFMSKKETFSYPVLGWLITKVNAFPVDRGTADIKSLKYACKIVEKGYILGIFPEGTRSKTGEQGEAKRGVSTIIARTKCDVLPVSVYNEDNFKKRSKTTVRYGELIKYSDFNFSSKPTKEELANAADYIMAKIQELNDMGHNE